MSDLDPNTAAVPNTITPEHAAAIRSTLGLAADVGLTIEHVDEYERVKRGGPFKPLPPLEPVSLAAREPDYAAGYSDGCDVVAAEAADKIEAIRRELDAVRAAGEVVREQLCVDLQEMSNKLAAALAAGAITQAQLQSLAACTPRPLDKTEAEKLIRSTPSSADFVDLEVKQLIADLEGTIGKGALECRCLGALRFLLEHFNDGDEAATKAKEEADGAAHALTNAKELHEGAIEAKDLEIKDLKKALASAEKDRDESDARLEMIDDRLSLLTPVSADAPDFIVAALDWPAAALVDDDANAKKLEDFERRIAALVNDLGVTNEKAGALEEQIASLEGAAQRAKREAEAEIEALRQTNAQLRETATNSNEIASKVAARADEVAVIVAENETLKAERASLNDKLGPIVKAWVGVVAPKLRAFEANGNDPQNVAGDLVADADVKAALSVTP